MRDGILPHVQLERLLIPEEVAARLVEKEKLEAGEADQKKERHREALGRMLTLQRVQGTVMKANAQAFAEGNEADRRKVAEIDLISN